MYCHKCGTELPKVALFCPNCGTKVPIIPHLKSESERDSGTSESQNASTFSENTTAGAVDSSVVEAVSSPATPAHSPLEMGQGNDCQRAYGLSADVTSTIQPDSDAALSTVVKRNTAYYLPEFQRIHAGALPRFNWAAFLFGIYFCLYRKCTELLKKYFLFPCILLIAASVVLSVSIRNGLLAVAVGSALAYLTATVWYLVNAIRCGRNFNREYYHHATKALSDGNAKKFGTSIGAVVACFLVLYVGNLPLNLALNDMLANNLASVFGSIANTDMDSNRETAALSAEEFISTYETLDGSYISVNAEVTGIYTDSELEVGVTAAEENQVTTTIFIYLTVGEEDISTFAVGDTLLISGKFRIIDGMNTFESAIIQNIGTSETDTAGTEKHLLPNNPYEFTDDDIASLQWVSVDQLSNYMMPDFDGQWIILTDVFIDSYGYNGEDSTQITAIGLNQSYLPITCYDTDTYHATNILIETNMIGRCVYQESGKYYKIVDAILYGQSAADIYNEYIAATPYQSGKNAADTLYADVEPGYTVAVLYPIGDQAAADRVSGFCDEAASQLGFTSLTDNVDTYASGMVDFTVQINAWKFAEIQAVYLAITDQNELDIVLPLLLVQCDSLGISPTFYDADGLRLNLTLDDLDIAYGYEIN